ncbi:MAG: DNA cytosine methyltransferase, partial [Dactylosporangium sp.]|nr:DNA cytosine methyltransferase [Dactylosporangium sp.]
MIPAVDSRGVAISLFSGAGGLDLGAERAGYEVRAAVEWDRDAVQTMEKNFEHLASPVIQKNILEVPTKEILAAAGLGKRERPDLLLGGPPCTPFSKSGFWLEWKRAGLDPTASLLQAYTRVLSEARPRYFVLENVYALTYNNRASRPAYERLLREIDEAGYHCRAKVLNAADYGVPQSRPRLFVIGVMKGERLPDHPRPTHGGTWEGRATGSPAAPHVTAGQAFEGLVTEPEPGETVAGKYGHLLPDIPPGDNYLFYTKKRGHPDPQFKWRGKYWS